MLASISYGYGASKNKGKDTSHQDFNSLTNLMNCNNNWGFINLFY